MADFNKASPETQQHDAQPITNPPPYTPPIPQKNLPMPRNFNGKEYYGAADVARVIGVTQKTVWTWQNSGYFTADERAHDGRYLYLVERVLQLKDVYRPDWNKPACLARVDENFQSDEEVLSYGDDDREPISSDEYATICTAEKKRVCTKKISDRTVERLRQISLSQLISHGIIKPAPNFNANRQSGLCCPLCDSGTHDSRNSDGAATFDSNNKLYCHACHNEANGGHKLSTIDLYQIARNLQHERFGEVCRQMCAEFGEYLEEEDFGKGNSRNRRRNKIPPPLPPKKIDPAELELIHADLATSDEPLIKFVEGQGGLWRGLPAEFLIRFGCKYVAAWVLPSSRVAKKFATPTQRILIPSSENFYVARFCGNLDDFDESTRKFVDNTKKLNAGSPALFNPAALDSDEPIFAVEGAIDGMSIEFAGYRAVALNSVSNGNLLVDAVAKMPKKPCVIILLDSDEQGRKAAPKLHDSLLDVGCPCCVRFLFDETTKTDANDILVAEGVNHLRGRLELIFDGARAELDAVSIELEKSNYDSVDGALIDFLFQGDSSDLDFAKRLENFCGDEIRWLTDNQSWLLYKRNDHGGGLWTDAGDKNSCLLPRANDLAELMLANAQNSDERKLAEKFTSTKKILQAITLLKGRRSVLITSDDLDTHSELICCLNGVVDLLTGKLMDADPKTFTMTRTVNAVFTKPRRENFDFIRNFFAQIMPDEMTRNGLLRWLGYCLTGDTSAEKFMIWIGKSGANGKGTLGATMLKLLGGYGVGLQPRALCKTFRPADADKATTALNGLEGRRFALSEEMPMDGELDLSLVKNLTGGDPINLRLNFKEFRTLINHAKINISGNYTPRIENVRDGGIIRRLLNMPFTQQFGTNDRPADPTLKKRLLEPENLSALLFILVHEATEYYKNISDINHGLIISDLMTQATQQHLNDSDFITDFLNEYYEFDAGLSVKAKDLIDKLKEKCPAECRPFRKRADLIKLIEAVPGIEYGEGRGHERIFKGIGKLRQFNDSDDGYLSSSDYPPF